MRLRISLEAAKGGFLGVPVQYNHLLQGLIYNNLDHTLSSWLHEEGHAYGARRFKLFTFSRLFGKREAKNGRIRFDGPVHFYLGSVDSEVLGSFAEHLLTKPAVRLGSSECRITEVGVEPEPEIDPTKPVLVKVLSPITAYSTLTTAEGKKRTRRPPANRINALVSFGNSLMYVTVLSEIHQTHLDPRIGFLHTTNQRRYTLNLDVAEIFKPIIVDRVIFTLVNRGVLKAKDFREGTEGVFLTEKGRKTFLEAYEARLKETVQHPRLGRAVSYRRLIRLELYKLEKHLLGDEPYEPYVSRW